MKFAIVNDDAVSSFLLTGSENCDTDSWPFVSQIFFRNVQGAHDGICAAIAAAILFARHCGSVAEFEGGKLGIDASRTIRTIVEDVEEVLPIDGTKRDIGQGVISLVVGEAERIFDGRMKPGVVGRAARAIAWSGDFVPSAGNSSRFVGGDIHTNARLVTSSTSVSVALALLIGGRGLRDIYVPEPPTEEAGDFDRIAAGLEFVSIKLRAI